MRRVLLVIPDLIFNVKVADAVRALGGTTVDVTRETAPAQAIGADLLVIDAAPTGPGLDIVRLLKSDPATAVVPVLAFGSHVDVTAQRAAVTAGCDRVVTRGKLAAELPALLTATARQYEL